MLQVEQTTLIPFTAALNAAGAEWNSCSSEGLAEDLLRRIAPVQYDRPVTRGKTEPLFITCEDANGETIEVVAKFSAGCEQGNVNLAREVIGACLAGDLGLPLPEPFLIQISPDWAATVPIPKIARSSPVAFGSAVVTRQWGVWAPGNVITEPMLQTAAAIFVFDGIIQNPDRRSSNPNCFVRGDDLRIFDHELAFSHEMIIAWVAPWRVGGLKSLETEGNHIFRMGLRSRAIDYDAIRRAWTGLSDGQIADYEGALPAEWPDVASAAASAIRLIRSARDNIDGVLDEVKRVLS